jgi:hypothetical protein
MHLFGRMDWMTYLQRLAPLLGALALAAAGLCAGTLASVSWLAHRARWMADGPEIGRLAVSLFYRRSVPLLLLALSASGVWLYATGVDRLRAPFAVGLAGAAVVVTVLLVVVGGRARRAAVSF